MEGKETSLSHHSEESSVSDLPSVGDLAEIFQPPSSAESSEEPFCSPDTFPSPLPGGTIPFQRMKAKMKLKFGSHLQNSGDELRGRTSPRENKSLDTPAVLLPISSERPVVVALRGESNPPSAVPASFSAGSSEEGNVRRYPEAGLCEHAESPDASLSSMYERENAEDASIRKSLDGFYETYCKKGPGRADPTCEAASRCLSQKVAELANRGGTKYALRCLQMAQVVLNRDGCKIFPNYPTTACFSKPAEGEAVLEDAKRTPGLSDDVLQFLLKQTQAEHSPDVLHEK